MLQKGGNMQQLISKLHRDEKVQPLLLALINGETLNLRAPKIEYHFEKDYFIVMHSDTIEYFPYSSIFKIFTHQQ